MVLILAGRYAWQNCQWEWVSMASAFAVIAGTLIGSWVILRARPALDESISLDGQALASVRAAILLLCVGMLIAGFGDTLGKLTFGCAG